MKTESSPSETRNAFKLWIINENISYLLGQVLTIIDASTEGEKNIALKSIIKDKFSSRQDFLTELAWKEQEPEGMGHGPAREWEDGLVPFDSTKKYSFQ